VAAPESAAEAPEAPLSGRRPNVVGVDSYGQTSPPAQPPPGSIGQPTPTTAPNTAALPPTVAPPTNPPPADVP